MRQHREMVWHLCWRFAHGDRDRCKDMVQEVWLAMWLKFDMLSEDANVWQQRAWVWRVARSVLVDLYRRPELATERITDMMAEVMADRHINYAEDIDDLLAHLTSDEQRLMQMRLDGYDAAEIGEALGINRNAVYQRMNRIINKLRKQYGT